MFTVVVPLYNKAHTIVATLESVLAQDLHDFEVVVVDDGSTDGGPELIRRTFRDSRIRIISQPHAGAGAARNAGIDSARCELVAFLDADDLIRPRYLSTMKRAIDAFPEAGMYCCGGVTIYPDGRTIVRRSPTYRRVGEVNFFDNPAFFCNSSSTIVRKSLLHPTGGFPVGMTSNEDIVFFYSLALQVPVVFCPDLLTVYQQGIPGQATADRRGCYRSIARRSTLLYRVWNNVEAGKRDPKLRVVMLHHFRQSLLYFLKNGDEDSFGYVLSESDPELVAQLTSAERFLFSRPALRPLSFVSLIAATCVERVKVRPQPRVRGRFRRVLSLRSPGSSPGISHMQRA